ncbi:unnamed protein product [Didymodactylos carnosus]|uniref:Glucosidase 2 subunit beta n=1 Tax=Didymodactylos carnosus TaxID=1234261 RepID=A0A8S2J9J5_9BILA|nr:unnamed protein product [Didymodactylos carnosus]CAF3787726.1 unnamed protein product [Didymodactylos carnosus]
MRTVLRGVKRSMLSKYIPSKPFTCFDGSISMPFDFVNDDYCDCRDGSDEPGTSACPNGQFFCENKGYVGIVVPSQFVGDGVCDCCDGSDEYENEIVCNNTCFILAKKTNEQRETQRLLHEQGVAKKNEMISKANAFKAERAQRLEELEEQLKRLEVDLQVKLDLKNQAEELETASKDKHEEAWEEQRAARELLQRDEQIKDIFNDLDTNQDKSISIEELKIHTELDDEKENEFTNDEVRTILGGDSATFDEFNSTVFDQISNSYKKITQTVTNDQTTGTESSNPTPLDEPSKVTRSENYDETDNEKYDSNDMDDIDNKDDISNEKDQPTSLGHTKHVHDDIAPDFDEETKKLIQIADQARKVFEDAEEKVQDIKREIEDLKKRLEIDFGPEDEFSTMFNECYNYEEREYTYRVCMFKTASQIPKGGGSEVVIGHWESWGSEPNKYSVMKYTNGVSCWNGPSRALTVQLRCGIEHRAIDVREPTKCKYSMIFETPAACDKDIASKPLDQHTHTEF